MHTYDGTTGSAEVNRTMMQILAGDVRVMAATNRIDIKIHTKNMSIADDVKLEEIAAITEDASGADLKAIVTEAGMFAIRKRNNIEVRLLLELQVDMELHFQHN